MTKEFTPEERKIHDVINDDMYSVFQKMAQNQALNLVIYRIIDDLEGTGIDPKVNSELNHAHALLNLQEDLLKSLDMDISHVVSKISRIVCHTDENKEENGYNFSLRIGAAQTAHIIINVGSRFFKGRREPLIAVCSCNIIVIVGEIGVYHPYKVLFRFAAVIFTLLFLCPYSSGNRFELWTTAF